MANKLCSLCGFGAILLIKTCKQLLVLGQGPTIGQNNNCVTLIARSSAQSCEWGTRTWRPECSTLVSSLLYWWLCPLSDRWPLVNPPWTVSWWTKGVTEVMAVYMLHCWRRCWRDKDAWNQSFNISDNQMTTALKHPSRICRLAVFTVRCYAECGYATVCRLSVRQRSSTVIN